MNSPDRDIPGLASSLPQWERMLASLQATGQHIARGSRVQTPLAQAQLCRYLQRVLRGMLLTAIEVDDADYPQLVRLFDTYLPYGNSNPDCTYFHATVAPQHDYRIHGRRGTARILEIQLMDGHFVAAPAHKGLRTLTDIQPDADGNIDVLLSATERPGVSLPLDPGAHWLYVRQYFYDWDTEVPADLVIERVGAEYPPPLPSAAALARRFDQLIEWIPTWYRFLEARMEGYFAAPADRCVFSTSTGGMDGMFYGKGHFRCEPDEAVIVEFRPPECRYWSFQIMNTFWESQEFDVRQTSLNGHQARLDPDGVFRGVISITDPGVPNWLDPVGHAQGLICARALNPARPPEVALRVVRLDALRRELHAATPTITAAERSATLHRRMLAARRRYRE